MRRKPVMEATYYPQVQAFLKKQGYVCESVNRVRQPIHFITKGIDQIIMDVFGVKSAPSQYSTEFEVAAVEVKRNTRRASLRDMNQAFNNSKLAHYCYLAMPRRFTEKEKVRAAELGIGLLEMGTHGAIRLVAQSRRFQPSLPLLREFFRKALAIGQCSICHNFVSLYDMPEEQERREGGGWRNNLFATKDKWSYFCPQCRKRFENTFTERAMLDIRKRLRMLETKQKTLKGVLTTERHRTQQLLKRLKRQKKAAS